VGGMKCNDSGFVKLYYIPSDRCKKKRNWIKTSGNKILPADEWKMSQDKS
jgi:hypothetical protein